MWLTCLSQGREKGAVEAWELGDGLSSGGKGVSRTTLWGTTYPELPAKDGNFAFNLFLS